MATTPLAKEAAYSALLTGSDETSERVRERLNGLVSVPKKTPSEQKYRRPESRTSTMYKTGFVPNTNTKESMKITKRARFSAQDHLLTYPVYKSAYSDFSLKHPKMMRAGRNAIKRADMIPPFKVALDLKNKAAERILRTADHLMPLLKTTEVLDLKQPFDNLLHAVQGIIVPPTGNGFQKMKLALRSRGEKIQSITMPMLPERLRRQFERAEKSDPPTPAASATSEIIRTIEAEVLYEKHYQILTKILRKSSTAECNLCDLVKFLYIRSSNDGENGKQLNDIIMGWGQEAANNANGEESMESEQGTHDSQPQHGANLVTEQSSVAKKPTSRSASDHTSIASSGLEVSGQHTSAWRSNAPGANEGARRYEVEVESVPESHETSDSNDLYEPVSKEELDEDNSSRLSMPLGILKIAGSANSHEATKQNKSVRFSDDASRAAEASSHETSRTPSDFEEFQRAAEQAMVAYDDPLDDQGYLAQIGARQIVDNELFSLFQNSEEDVFSGYAYAADVIFSGGTLSLS